jgi:hypothetical protein
MFHLTIFIPLSLSGKSTGTLSGFIARVKLASFGLLCVWCEVLILRQHTFWHEERNVTSMGTFLVILFFLAAEGATKGGAFLLSEVELIRVGSIVAYLAIN